MSKAEYRLPLYIVRRLLVTIPVILGILVITFFIIHSSPGDPVYKFIGATGGTKEFIEQTRHRLALDRPLYEQLVTFIVRVFQGDLGYSLVYNERVVDIISSKAPATVLLMASSLLFLPLGIGLGTFASTKPNTKSDRLVLFFSLIAFSLPTFWVGQMLIYILAVRLNIFPFIATVSLVAPTSSLDYILDVAYRLVLPSITLGTWFLAETTRLTRGSMMDALSQSYIVTARSKGLSERAITYRHALRNSLGPIVTYTGLIIATMFSATVLVENVFSWPGLGRLMYDALLNLDYPLLLGIFVYVSIAVVLATLVTDIVVAIIDPRIRYK